MSADEPRRSSAALGVGAILGTLVAVPAIVRVTAAGVSAGTVVPALAGGSALVLGVVLALLDRASVNGARLSFAFAGVGLAAWPVAAFAALLERTTHHRPLGAATFALVALALVLGCLAVARRVAALERRRLGRVAAVALYVLALSSTGVVLLGALREGALRPHVLDGGLLVVGAALGWAALRRGVVRGSLSRVGLALWIALVAGHLLAVTRPGFDQVRDRARVLSGPMGWF